MSLIEWLALGSLIALMVVMWGITKLGRVMEKQTDVTQRYLAQIGDDLGKIQKTLSSIQWNTDAIRRDYEMNNPDPRGGSYVSRRDT